MGPKKFTEKAFRGLKSTSSSPQVKEPHYSSARGRHCEKIVARYFKSLGYTLCANNLRTPFAEVDLVFNYQGDVYIVEVKSLGPLSFADFRLSANQKKRLARACEYLMLKFNREVCLQLALVNRQDEIEVFDIDFDSY